MNIEQEKMLKEVMALDFSIIELNLYLDTHPGDRRALAIYNNYVHKLMMLKSTYEKLYGPLTARCSYSAYPWKWIDSPWPWEYQPEC